MFDVSCARNRTTSEIIKLKPFRRKHFLSPLAVRSLTQHEVSHFNEEDQRKVQTVTHLRIQSIMQNMSMDIPTHFCWGQIKKNVKEGTYHYIINHYSLNSLKDPLLMCCVFNSDIKTLPCITGFPICSSFSGTNFIQHSNFFNHCADDTSVFPL